MLRTSLITPPPWTAFSTPTRPVRNCGNARERRNASGLQGIASSAGLRLAQNKKASLDSGAAQRNAYLVDSLRPYPDVRPMPNDRTLANRASAVRVFVRGPQLYLLVAKSRRRKLAASISPSPTQQLPPKQAKNDPANMCQLDGGRITR